MKKDWTRIPTQYSEYIYAGIVENTPGGACLIQNSIMTYVNHNLCELLGYSKDELVGHTLQEFVHPKDVAIVNENIREEGGGVYGETKCTFRVLTRTGEERYVEMLSKHLEKNSDNPLIVGVLTDVTDHVSTTELIENMLTIEKFISRASSRFISSEDFQKSILDTLQEAGELSGATGVYVCLFTKDKKMAFNKYEWYAEGTSPKEK